MRIHILSDLHLEFGSFTPPDAHADLVVLAGDVDIGVKGVRWAKQAFPQVPVIYVPGNHEYYRQAFPSLLEKLHAEAHGSSVRVLERDAVEISGITVLGCTLWTDFALHGDSLIGERIAASVMTDYKLIRVSPHYRRLRPRDTASVHRASVDWLRNEAAAQRGRQIMVSHHAPSALSLSQEERVDLASAAYASNLESLIQDLRPALWVHGHLHHRCDYRVGETRVICNPRGYAQEPCSDFDPNLVLEIAL